MFLQAAAVSLLVLCPLAVEPLPPNVINLVLRNQAEDYFQCECLGFQPTLLPSKWMHSAEEYGCLANPNGTYADSACGHLTNGCQCKPLSHLRKRQDVTCVQRIMDTLLMYPMRSASAGYMNHIARRVPDRLAAGEVLFELSKKVHFLGNEAEAASLLARFKEHGPEIAGTFANGERRLILKQIAKDVARAGLPYSNPDRIDSQLLSHILMMTADGFLKSRFPGATMSRADYFQAWSDIARRAMSYLPADKVYVMMYGLSRSPMMKAFLSGFSDVKVEATALAILKRFQQQFPEVHAILNEVDLPIESILATGMQGLFLEGTTTQLFGEIYSAFLKEGGGFDALSKIGDVVLVRSVPEILRIQKEYETALDNYAAAPTDELARQVDIPERAELIKDFLLNKRERRWSEYYDEHILDFGVHVRDYDSLLESMQF